MNAATLHITLLDDTIISQSAASEGAHHSLDYIPGATLLGVAAAKLYSTLSEADQYLVFHSGKVRFGDSLPLADDGEMCFPMPLCWHVRKGEAPKNEQRINPEAVRNLQWKTFDDGAQPQQVRNGYVGLSLKTLEPALRFRMKTAINPDTQRVAEGQLFGYQAIAAGAHFASRIDADHDVSPNLFEQILQALTGEVRVGRSRSAEYGRVRISRAEAIKLSGSTTSITELNLWLQSDMCLLDPATGQATLDPAPINLGLPPGRWNSEKTFLRTRSYSPFNAKRRARDLERAVILRGSVLHYTLDAPLTDTDKARLEAGIGLYREAGLGRVLINSIVIGNSQPQPDEPIVVRLVGVNAGKAPVSAAMQHPLSQWLESRTDDQTKRNVARAHAMCLARDLSKLYQSARKLMGKRPGVPVGPSPSQWGSVLTVVKNCDTRKESLIANLFTNPGAVCPERDAWIEEGMVKGAPTKFRAWLNKALNDTSPDDIEYVVATLARRAQDIARKENSHAG